jgi:uncharacterized membrane protein
MTQPFHPAVDRYMARFQTALRRYHLPDEAEIAADLRGHIAEALAYGKPAESVVESLGPADGLARAYAVELLMGAPNRESRESRAELGGVSFAIRRLLIIFGIVAAGGFATAIVALSLGGISLVVALMGPTMLVLGVAELAGAPVPGSSLGPFSPLAAIVLSPVPFAIGCAGLWAFWRYIRFLARLLVKTLPRSGLIAKATL